VEELLSVWPPQDSAAGLDAGAARGGFVQCAGGHRRGLFTVAASRAA
jgi:hypothetical protein